MVLRHISECLESALMDALEMREAGGSAGDSAPPHSAARDGRREDGSASRSEISATDRGTVWGHGVASPGQPQVLPTNRVNASREIITVFTAPEESERRSAVVISMLVWKEGHATALGNSSS